MACILSKASGDEIWTLKQVWYYVINPIVLNNLLIIVVYQLYYIIKLKLQVKGYSPVEYYYSIICVYWSIGYKFKVKLIMIIIIPIK